MTIRVSREIAREARRTDRVKVEGNCDVCQRLVGAYLDILTAAPLLREEKVTIKGPLTIYHKGGRFTDCPSPTAELLLIND